MRGSRGGRGRRKREKGEGGVRTAPGGARREAIFSDLYVDPIIVC